MKTAMMIIAVILLLVMITGCAPGPNTEKDIPDDEGKVAGFWKGLWHGIIAPFTFIISLFSDKVHMYEVHNTGNWYNFGFLIGVMIIFGSGGGGAGRKSRCR